MVLFGLNGEAVVNDTSHKVLVTVLVAAITSTATFFAGRWWGRYLAGRQWRKKEFLERVIISLNTFSDGYLKIRTVLERSLDEVFLNQVAVNKVLAAARRTSLERPLLPLPPADRWYILNFVLNAVAEHFVAGHIRRDAGVTVTVVKYALFLTCEKVGEERIRKIRAMLVRLDVLTDFPYPDSLPLLENPWHDDRIKTLRAAAEVYRKEPDNFLIVEACI